MDVDIGYSALCCGCRHLEAIFFLKCFCVADVDIQYMGCATGVDIH